MWSLHCLLIYQILRFSKLLGLPIASTPDEANNPIDVLVELLRIFADQHSLKVALRTIVQYLLLYGDVYPIYDMLPEVIKSKKVSLAKSFN